MTVAQGGQVGGACGRRQGAIGLFRSRIRLGAVFAGWPGTEVLVTETFISSTSVCVVPFFGHRP